MFLTHAQTVCTRLYFLESLGTRLALNGLPVINNATSVKTISHNVLYSPLMGGGWQSPDNYNHCFMQGVSMKYSMGLESFWQRTWKKLGTFLVEVCTAVLSVSL